MVNINQIITSEFKGIQELILNQKNDYTGTPLDELVKMIINNPKLLNDNEMNIALSRIIVLISMKFLNSRSFIHAEYSDVLQTCMLKGLMHIREYCKDASLRDKYKDILGYLKKCNFWDVAFDEEVVSINEFNINRNLYKASVAAYNKEKEYRKANPYATQNEIDAYVRNYVGSLNKKGSMHYSYDVIKNTIQKLDLNYIVSTDDENQTKDLPSNSNVEEEAIYNVCSSDEKSSSPYILSFLRDLLREEMKDSRQIDIAIDAYYNDYLVEDKEARESHKDLANKYSCSEPYITQVIKKANEKLKNNPKLVETFKNMKGGMDNWRRSNFCLDCA